MEAFLCCILCCWAPQELHRAAVTGTSRYCCDVAEGEAALMQGDVAWCEYEERWLRGSATFYLPSTTGAMPRNTANGAGRRPPGYSVPASHFRTVHCPRRITSCYTRWWLTNMTKAYRLHLGKALALDDLPAFAHCTLLALLQLTDLSTLCFFFNFLLCLSFFCISLFTSISKW